MPAEAPAVATPSPKPQTTSPPTKPAAPPHGPKPEAPRAEKRSLESYFDSGDHKPAPPQPSKPKQPDKTPPPQPPPQPEPAKQVIAEPETPVEAPEPQDAPEQPAAVEDPLQVNLEQLLGHKETPKPAEHVPSAPKELRKAYDQARKEIAELRKKAEQVEQLASFREQHEALAKERDELAAKLEQANYVESPRYKQEWEEPFVNKLDALYTMAKRLPAEDSTRVGSETDVNEVFSMWGRNPAAAIQKATEVFGPAAGQLVINQVAELAEFQAKREQAVGKWASTRAQRRQQEQEEATRRNQMKAEAYLQQIDTEREKYKEVFDYSADKELNTLWDKGAQVADAVIYGIDDNAEVSDQDKWRAKASIRNRAAAFAPMYAKIKKQTARIAQLEKEIEEYRSSEPTVQGSKGNEKPTTSGNVLDRMDDYFKK